MNMLCKILLVCWWCVVCAWSGADASSSTHPLLLIVSFDGFRYDQLDKTDTPNFDALIADGVKAKWMEASFPTKTFPNHYTLATGLYTESHGIVANKFYDPDLNATFSSATGMNVSHWWDAGGEPIWVTNQRCGRAKEAEPGCRSRRSGAFAWPGSGSEVKGQRPHRHAPYDFVRPFRDRVDAVVSWFTDEDTPINLGLLHIYEPDGAGHQYGPYSPEVRAMIEAMDNVTGYLVKRLRDVGLYDRVNLIITSDHGMASVHPNLTIMLDDYIDSATYRGESIPGSVALIYPMAGEEDTIYEQLSKLDHITAWRKRDVPSYYHYSNNPRIADIVVMADEHWAIATNAVSLSMSRPWFPNPYKGDHGYDNRAMSMHPFFVARGPAFRKGLISEPFANVNVYPLMCEILGLAPAPNNGSIANVKHLLREELTGLIQKPGSVNPFSVSAQLLPNIISICVGVAVVSMLVLQ